MKYVRAWLVVGVVFSFLEKLITYFALRGTAGVVEMNPVTGLFIASYGLLAGLFLAFLLSVGSLFVLEQGVKTGRWPKLSMTFFYLAVFLNVLVYFWNVYVFAQNT